MSLFSPLPLSSATRFDNNMLSHPSTDTMKSNILLRAVRAKLFHKISLAAAALALLSAPSVHATSATYTPTDTTNPTYWSDNYNWAPQTAPGTASGVAGTRGGANTDTATFNTAVGTEGSSANPLLIDAGREIDNITFSGAASGYVIGTVGGNTLYLSAGGAITNSGPASGSVITETINAPLVLEGSYNINAGGSKGQLILNGTITDGAASGNQTLTFNGASPGTQNKINGNISDGTAGGTVAGATLAISATSQYLLFGGNNSYSGGTTISGGNFQFGTNTALGTGFVQVGSGNFGAAVSGLNLANALRITSGATVDFFNNTNTTYSGGVSFLGSATFDDQNNSTTTLNFTTNNIYLDNTATTGNTLSMNNTGGQGGTTLNFSSSIQDFNGTNNGGQGKINISGPTVILSGNNTYSGGTTFSSGYLGLGSNSALGTGTFTDNQGNSNQGIGSTISAGVTIANNVVVGGAALAVGGIGQGSAWLANNVTFTGAISGATNYGIDDQLSTGLLTFSGPTITIQSAAGTSSTLQIDRYWQTASTQTINISDVIQNFTSASTGGASGALNIGGPLANDTATGTLTVVLTGANTYTGVTNIYATKDILQLGNGGGTGSLSALSTITDNGTLTIDRTGTITQGTDFSTAAITGSGGFVQLGSGTTVFTANNSYTGTTVITTGALQLGNGTGSKVTLTNSTAASGSAITDNSSLIFDEGAAVVEGTDFSTSTAAITGTGTVTVEGPGAVTFNKANTFNGLTDAGAVNFSTVAAAGAAQSLGEGLITLAGTSSTTGLLTYTGAAGTLGDNITVTTGDQGTITNNSTGILTLAGAISKNGSILNLVGGPNLGGFTVTGAITGAMAGSDLNIMNTAVTLTSAGNNYNGPTTISANATDGTTYNALAVSGAGVLSPNSVINFGSSQDPTTPPYAFTNVLDLDGTNQTVAGLASIHDTALENNEVVNSIGNQTGTTYSTANGTAATLTIAPAAGTSYTYGGTVGNPAGLGSANNIAVVINGASTGTQQFTGANTYTGGTTVTSGTLQAGSPGALGAGNVTINGNGGTLAGTVAAVNLAANFSLSAGTFIENTTGTGTFTLTGSANSFAISGGTWDLDIAGAPTSNNYDMVDSNNAANLFTISGANSTLNLVGTGLTAGTYDILNGFSAASTGDFAYINTNNSAYTAQFEVVNGTGELIVSAASTPEPTTWAMLLGGVVLLITIQRRRRTARL